MLVKKERRPKELDIGLYKDCRSTWGPRQAVRELLSNWFDVMKKHSINNADPIITKNDKNPMYWEARINGENSGFVSFDEQTNTLIIENEEGVLNVKHLCLGYSESSEGSIGMFGEGLKLGIHVLINNLSEVSIRTANDRWEFLFKKSKQFKIETLHAKRNTYDYDCGKNGTRIEIQNISSEHLPFNDILWLNPPSDTNIYKYAGICMMPSLRGKIFRRGVLLCENERLYCGYDIHNDHEIEYFTRNRGEVDLMELGKLLSIFWCEAIELGHWNMYLEICQSPKSCIFELLYVGFHVFSQQKSKIFQETINSVPVLKSDSASISKATNYGLTPLLECEHDILYKFLINEVGHPTLGKQISLRFDKEPFVEFENLEKNNTLNLFLDNLEKHTGVDKDIFSFKNSKYDIPVFKKGGRVVINIKILDPSYHHGKHDYACDSGPYCFCMYNFLVENATPMVSEGLKNKMNGDFLKKFRPLDDNITSDSMLKRTKLSKKRNLSMDSSSSSNESDENSLSDSSDEEHQDKKSKKEGIFQTEDMVTISSRRNKRKGKILSVYKTKKSTNCIVKLL
jgi:hypothetical protein